MLSYIDCLTKDIKGCQQARKQTKNRFEIYATNT